MQTGLSLHNLQMFSGLENYEDSNGIPSDKVYYAKNARFTGYNLVSKPGYASLGDMLTGGTKFTALIEYPYFSSGVTDKRLIGMYNKIFRQFNSSTQTWDTISTTWPSVADSETQGVLYNNKLYFINPMLANVDGIGKIDNATFSVVPSSPRGIAIETWAERLWVIGDYDAPNSVFASRAASAANPSYIEDWTTSPILELLGKGGKNVAIRVLNNELFVWKQDSIWYNTTDRLAAGTTSFIELSRTGGAINQKSTIVVENDVWFLSQNGKKIEVRSLGLERQLGNNPRTRALTSIIQSTMNILDPVQDNPVMSYNDRLVKISLKSLESPTNNVQITFDYNTGAYSLDIGQAIDLVTVWDGELIYSEDSAAGQVFNDEVGYTANGAAYVFDVHTGFMDDKRPDTEKRARYLYIKGKQSYTQAITIRLYRGDYSTYSDYTIPSPADRGVTVSSSVEDATWGSRELGDSLYGGTWEGSNDITMYPIKGLNAEDGYLISIDRRSTAFAVGVNAQINGGKLEIEQIILKLIPDNENYKRSNL